jgi:hypothetical protein
VVSDEVYEWLTYDGVQHERIATLPGMWERTITISSASKTFSVTGWKIGTPPLFTVLLSLFLSFLIIKTDKLMTLFNMFCDTSRMDNRSQRIDRSCHESTILRVFQYCYTSTRSSGRRSRNCTQNRLFYHSQKHLSTKTRLSFENSQRQWLATYCASR